MTKSISVTLPEDTARALGELAEATAISEPQLVLEALRDYLEEYSDAAVALQRSRDDSDPTIPSAAMHDWLEGQE